MDSILIGEYKYFPNCRFCNSSKVKKVIDLGYIPLAGGFLKDDLRSKQKEKFYPLQLNFCKNCFLLQVNSSINPDILFKDYFYFSSSIKTLVDHFEKISAGLSQKYKNPSKKFIVEIGCNDGAFIEALQKEKFNALGIDPALNIVKSVAKKKLPILNSYFTYDLAKKIIKKYGRANAIYSFHSMAHIEDMHTVAKGIKILLKKDGFLSMEVHYLKNLIKEMQYDMIYHEHQFYYTLHSIINFFRQYDMKVFDVNISKMRGGSITFFVQHKNGPENVTNKVGELLRSEKKDKLNQEPTYLKFSKKINLRKKQLLSILNKLKDKRKRIVGYGASGRGTIIANYCLLDKYLDYIVDDAPAKHGLLLPGTHHKIYQSKKMIKDKAEYAVLFAWPFFKEVEKNNRQFIKNGGKFIIPLPKVKIL